MKYIIAVSGGVDSVVLLDMVVRHELFLSPSESSWRTRESRISRESRDTPAPIVNASDDASESSEFIVCHFDHGIRPESDADARFVWELAKKYGLPCEIRREELGPHASEALARERRYMFLQEIAKKYHGKIVTAHHQDDVIETIAINVARGTGWRGVAVLRNEMTARPLLGFTKQMLRDYALAYRLEWVEDETNATDHYQRNRLRRQLYRLSDDSRQSLLDLWNRQLSIRTELEKETANLVDNDKNSRYFFIMIPESVALEFLRLQTNGRLTRPQLRAMLLAIKTFRAGQKFEAGNGIVVSVGLRYFTMKDPSGLI